MGTSVMKIRFNEITSKREFARFLDNIPLKKLTYILYIKKAENYYTSFEIPKKNGGKRIINAPTGDLKDLQRKLARELWKHQKYIWEQKKIKPNLAHGFEKGKSIISNARIHRNKKYILNLDLENFFDSFHFGRVKGFFAANNDFKVSEEVATIIAQLSCYNGSLPQGAPSSPIITNLICQILDYQILKISKKYKLDYTRYADDITFSTNNKNFLSIQDDFIAEVDSKIKSTGFSVNDKKTRLLFGSSQQKVTGLVVNKKLNVDRQYCRETNAMAHTLYKTDSFVVNSKLGTLSQLEGRYAFINQLDRYNNSISNEKHNFRNLSGRERQYQKFLFYKYFYGNSKALIVTEGKTDIAYLKAALKNLYSEYPTLITRNDEGQFKFNVSFLKRTKRLKHFFDFPFDGADAIQKIYNFYCGNNNMPNYFEYFKKLSNAKKPVFLFFDNEISSKDKPLKKFADTCRLSEDQKKELSDNLLLNSPRHSNLYTLTTPQLGNEESEIEDLFEQSVRDHKIGGKSFSLSKEFDCEKHYGKEIFSRYIAANYSDINFTGFKPILNKISEVISFYHQQELIK